MTTTAYTPLEQLLVFQALRSEGVNSHSVFNRISDQLKSIPLVKNNTSYDSGRLSPDALRELYLWLLKEEVKADLGRRLDGEDGGGRNIETEPGSRKRKLPSPKLATVHEASQHAHLIPQLATRLYARYRELAVRDIKEAEKRYDNATKEIGEIEGGKWDERLQRQRTASATQSPRPSSKAHTQQHLKNTQANSSGTPSPAAQQESAVQPPPKRSSGLDALLNHGPEPQNGTASHRRNSSNTTLPPLSEMAPQSPRFGIPPKVPSHPSQQMQHGHPYNQSPTHAHQSPYPPQNGLNSPQVQQSLSRPGSSSSAKPFLPPPPGMTLPPPTPPQYNSPSLRGPHQPPPHQQRYGQPPQHRLSASYSPTNERAPMGYPAPTPGQPPPQNYYPPQQPYDRRSSYPVQAHQQQQHYGYPPQAPHAGGYQLQPFSVDPQDPARQAAQPLMQQQQPRMPPQTPGQPQRPPVQHGHYPNAPATAPVLSSQNPSLLPNILSRLGTPPPKAKQRPLFRNVKRLSLLQPDREIPSPVQDIEPLSPVQKRADLAPPSTRSTRARDAEPVEAEPPQRTTRGRGRSKRDRSPHSVVSSTADESARMTRSHSVSTAAGAVLTSDDRPGSRGHVKLEPSTPAGFVDDHETPTEPQSGAGGPMTRKRRGTLQSLPQPSSKRRRQGSISAASDDRHPHPSPGPAPEKASTITATRNFHKTSQTIMNDINSHKHASYFANAVRDKDAPGYSEIIKRSQNLKSIRAAITAGAKAVASAAASAAGSPSASGSGGTDGTVELERSTELMPPKAIVNAAQLEREVMRMFANAILFNPGEDGLVRDTREMAEDVDGLMRQWRGVEMEREDGVPAAEEETVEEEGRGAKRRKL